MLTIDKLNKVSFAAAIEYERNIPNMIEEINDRMIKLNDEFALIGENPISVMFDNHENHAKFIANVLKLNDFEMLERTLTWAVESYSARGFKPEYFLFLLNNLIDIINKQIEPNYSSDIIKVYEYIIDEVKRTEKGKKRKIYGEYPFDDNWLDLKKEFTRILLDAKFAEAVKFTKEIVHDRESLEEFYLKVITYSMYEIGDMWQDGRITVAQEHLATSIVMRVMATVYIDFILIDYNKGKAIVSAASNEYHEVGARVVSDMLELDGWDVKYIGANIPNDEMINCIKEEKPVFVGISVAMTFNLDNVRDLIEKIRADEEIKDTKVFLGGLAFKFGSIELDIGADAIGRDIDDTIKVSREWWRKANAER